METNTGRVWYKYIIYARKKDIVADGLSRIFLNAN